MKVKPGLFSLSRNIDSLAAALFGFLLVQLFCRHSGIGVSPDSVTYLATARHLAHGQGLISFDNLPMADFPFGYPFLLTAIAFVTRLDPLTFGPWLNGILFGSLLYISGSMMNGFRTPSPWYKRILLACILLSPALQEVYSLLWSETVFLLVIHFFIICLRRYRMHSGSRWLILTAFVCAFGCITRYAGVFLIATGGMIIFFNSGMRRKKRIGDAALFFGISVSLLALNIWWNLARTGTATGPRPVNQEGLGKILEYFGNVLAEWFQLRPSLSLFLSVFVLVIFLIRLFTGRKHAPDSWSFERLAAVTGLMYCLFMILSSTVTRYELFTNRLLAPVYIPLLWSLSSWTTRWTVAGAGRQVWLRISLALIAAAWFLNGQLKADYEYYDGVRYAGVPGYREDEVTKSDIIQFIEKNKSLFRPDRLIYSNAGDAVYFVTGLAARQLPFIDFPDKIKNYYAAENQYLIWFNDLDDLQMPELQTILRNKKMHRLKQAADGAIYITN